jgi:transposase-like protein
MSSIESAIALIEAERRDLYGQLKALDDALASLRGVARDLASEPRPSGLPRPVLKKKAGTKRHYTAEQKTEGVKLAGRIGATAAAKQLGIHASMIPRWRRDAAGILAAGKLESTPSNPPVDNDPREATVASVPDSNHARETTGQDGARDLPGGEPVDLLNPATITGAKVIAGGAVVRQDGSDWECTCGKRTRTIGQLRQHILNTVNPDSHQLVPVAEPDTAGDPSGRYVCSCAARFVTERDWVGHRRLYLPTEQKAHRLADHPPVSLVPTGVPAKPRDETATRAASFDALNGAS